MVLPARLGAGSAVRPAPLFSLDRWRVSNATEIARNRLSEQGVGRAESRDQALFSTLPTPSDKTDKRKYGGPAPPVREKRYLPFIGNSQTRSLTMAITWYMADIREPQTTAPAWAITPSVFRAVQAS